MLVSIAARNKPLNARLLQLCERLQTLCLQTLCPDNIDHRMMTSLKRLVSTLAN